MHLAIIYYDTANMLNAMLNDKDKAKAKSVADAIGASFMSNIENGFLSYGELLTFRIPDMLYESNLLMPLGIYSESFYSADYFPLLPHFGFFLLGAVLGRTVYARKESLLPKINSRRLPIRFLCFCGRHSLLIYLLHQPILAALCEIYAFIAGKL